MVWEVCRRKQKEGRFRTKTFQYWDVKILDAHFQTRYGCTGLVPDTGVIKPLVLGKRDYKMEVLEGNLKIRLE